MQGLQLRLRIAPYGQAVIAGILNSAAGIEMTAIRSESVTFYTTFVNGGAGAPGLAPTVNVHGPTGIIINGAAATEVDAVNSPGLYSYTLAPVGSSGPCLARWRPT